MDKEHQKQVNIPEDSPSEQMKKGYQMQETPYIFDEELSSALQKLLDEPRRKTAEPQTSDLQLELPGKQQKAPEETGREAVRDRKDSSRFLSELLHTYSDSPLQNTDFSAEQKKAGEPTENGGLTFPTSFFAEQKQAAPQTDSVPADTPEPIRKPEEQPTQGKDETAEELLSPAEEKREKKKFHLFGSHRKKDKGTKTASQREETPQETAPAPERPSLPKEIPEDDTASLISVIASVVAQGEADNSAVSATETVAQTEQTSGDTQRFSPQRETAEDTRRFTPQHEAVQPKEKILRTQRFRAIRRGTAASQKNFWDEFDEVKSLVGSEPEDLFAEPETASVPETSQTPDETVQTEKTPPDTDVSEQTEEFPEIPRQIIEKKPKRKKKEKRRQAEASKSDTEGGLPSLPEEAASVLLTGQEAVVIQSAAAIPVPQSQPIEESQEEAQSPEITETHRHPRKHREEPAPVLSPEERIQAVQSTCEQKRKTLGARLAGAAILTVLSLALTLCVCDILPFLPPFMGTDTAGWVLLGMMVLSCLLAWDIYRETLQKLGSLQFTAPLLVLVATLAVGGDTFGATAAGRVPYCAAVCVLTLFLLWNRYDGITGVLATLQVLRDATEPTGIVEVSDVKKGRVGLSRSDGSIEDFLDNFDRTPPINKFLQGYVPVAIVIGLLASGLISSQNGSSFFWTASLVFLGSVPLIALMNFNRLFCILAKRLEEVDAALCGWHGAETFGGNHYILVNDGDLFSPKNIKLNGMKLLTKDADRVIAYTAATAKAADISLYRVFEEELRSRNARQYRTEHYRVYESGGIGAEISGDIVLVGTLDFMKRMGVHMEGGMKLRQAVYTSVNGELAAVFAVKYTPRDSVRRGLAAVAENRHFKTIFVTRDFLMTREMIGEKYEISLTNTSYPSAAERARLSENEFKDNGKQGALMADDSFGSFADTAAGGRVLNSAVIASVLLTLFNGLLGFLLMAGLTLWQGSDAATAANVLLYQLLWAVPTLLLTGWTRRY